MAEGDACNWSAAEVAQYVREQLKQDIACIPHVSNFDAEGLAAGLEDDDVNGFAFLDAIDKATLRNDYGIKNKGVTSAISRAIDNLRNKSKVFANLNAVQSSSQSALPDPVSDVLPAVEHVVGTNTRGREYVVEDSSGRKRRKLNLVEAVNVTTVDAPPNRQTNSSPNPPPSITTSPGSIGYLPDEAMPVDDMFYGNTPMGQQINAELSDDDVNFSIMAPRKTYAGIVQSVYSRLNHFMNASETEQIKFHGRPATALYPYRKGKGNARKGIISPPKGVIRSATVIQQQDNGEVTHIRVNADTLPFQREENVEVPDAIFSGAAALGPYDHLFEHWANRSDDDVLPPFDPDSMSITSSLADELEQDELEDAEERHGKLTTEQIERIAHGEVEAKTQDWDNIKRPRCEEKDAWSLWRKIRNRKTVRDSLIDGAQRQIKHLETRIEEYIKILTQEEWYTEQSLKSQCRGLDVTVAELAKEIWKMDVFQRRDEPYHERKPSKNKLNRAKAGPSNFPKADDMQGFVVEDHQPMPSIEDGDLGLNYRDKSIDNELMEVADGEGPSSPTQAVRDRTLSSDDEQESMIQSRDSSPGSEPPMEDAELDELPGIADMNLGLQDDVSEHGSDDDLPSPSKFTEQLRATQLAREQAIPKQETILISSDPPSPMPQPPSLIAPPKPTWKEEKAKNDRRAHLQQNPLDATQREIEAWTYDLLQRENCTDGILIKIIWDMEPEERKALLPYILRSRISDCFEDVQLACLLYPLEPDIYDGKDRKASLAIRYAARLFLCWHHELELYWHCSAEECGEDYSKVDEWDDNRLRRWHNVLKQSLQKAERTIIVIDDSDDENDEESDDAADLIAPTSTRKRAVKRNRAAINIQERALARHATSQTGSNAGILSQMIPGGSYSGDGILISASEDGEPSQSVFLNQDLSARLKPHQVEGVRFMWRELTVPDDEDGQGCVLAHTMGLGKTAQSISVLITMAETLGSAEKQHLVPKSFRQQRILILCPPSLVTNWRQELVLWDREHVLGRVFSVDSTIPSKEGRLAELRKWAERGGVLIIGYRLFTRFVDPQKRNKMKGSNSDKPEPADLPGGTALTSEERDEARKILTKRPTLVVADEAHMLKNQNSGTAKAVSAVATPRRVGLTGSPMSNNTQEVYALISWVAPGYLGSAEEFKAFYGEPIEQGTYAESTAAERRRSLKKLAALNKIIGPKLNRADITVLKGSLQQKVEFVLTVPLTEIQSLAYEKFVTMVLSGTATGKEGKVSQIKLFGWLSLLTLLTNHPWALRTKLQHDIDKLTPPPLPTQSSSVGGPSTAAVSKKSGKAPTAPPPTQDGATEHGAEESAPGDENISALEIQAAMAEEFLQHLPDSMGSECSYKAQMVEEIIKLSIQAGDKVILFSHSIPSLTYLQNLLRRNNFSYARIDGRVKQQDRTTILHNMESGLYDVLLVSTRAGGLGLNIQSANRVIIFDFGFNPTWEEQAIGRAYRLGQVKPVYVYRFVAGGTFESLLYDKAMFKTSLASRVVDKKNPVRNSTNKPSDWLYPPQPVVQEDIMSELGKDPQVLDRVVAQHLASDSHIRAIKTMETLQRDANDEPLTEEEQKEVEDEIRDSLLRSKGNKKVSMQMAPAATKSVQLGPIRKAAAPVIAEGQASDPEDWSNPEDREASLRALTRKKF